MKASVSDSSIGSILASYLGGGDVEKMRALGSLGSNLEGLSGGAGVVIQAGKKAVEPPQGSTVMNPKRGASLNRKDGSPAPAQPGVPAAPRLVATGPRPGANVGNATGTTSSAGARSAGVTRIEEFSSAGGKLRTTPMQPRYVGEDAPGNAMWRGSTVAYCRTSTERARFKLEVRVVEINGKRETRIFDAQGRPFDTRNATTWDNTSKAIFVMNADGELYASNYQEGGKFHHSSLSGGQPVAAAGEISVIAGKLVAITNRSGHYMPDAYFTEQLLTSLKNKGFELAGVTVTNTADGSTRVLQ